MNVHPVLVKHKSALPLKFLFTLVLGLLAFTTNCVVAQSGSGLYFSNPVLEVGVGATDGAVYRFQNVTTGIDALVTINGRSDSLVNILNIDMNTSGFDAAFQPQVGYNNGTAPGPADWWMEFTIRFVEGGTNTPATMLEFNVSGVDIDGNGQYINEYLSFYRMESYSFEANSGLSLSTITETVGDSTYNIGKRFDGPTANFANIDTGATTVMVSNHYVNTSSFVLRTGGRSTNVSGASDRMYSLYFREFNYDAPHQVTLALKEKTRQNRVLPSTAISMYPNPVLNTLKVNIPQNFVNTVVAIKIVDINGVIRKYRIIQKSGLLETMEMGDLEKGVYVVNYKSAAGMASARIVKN